MAIMTLIVLFLIEVFFLGWSIKIKDNLSEEKAIVSLSLWVIFVLFLFTRIFTWSFRYVPLLFVLSAQALFGIIFLIRTKEYPYKLKKNVFVFLRHILLFTLVLSIPIIFPQHQPPIITGSFPVATTKYTWTDPSRLENFTDSKENRALTVEFWYPENINYDVPLVVFSHGAFGFSGSNHSTFMELASQGYVVASIGHTYQALYTLDTKGTLTTVDSDFINRAMEISGSLDQNQEEETFKTTKEWMKLRIEDENFVLNTILIACQNEDADHLFSLIDREKIGLMGHSLGGASSAQVGRLRNDIDAVIVLDGTMMGEEMDFKNNEVVINDAPYPVPLLNIYAQDHYTNAKELLGEAYPNFIATKNGLMTYETIFKNAGHLNFTDLPLFSPILAKTLGVGTIDVRFCIETMNKIVLDFFNSYLKDGGIPNIAKEY